MKDLSPKGLGNPGGVLGPLRSDSPLFTSSLSMEWRDSNSREQSSLQFVKKETMSPSWSPLPPRVSKPKLNYSFHVSQGCDFFF